MNHLLLIISPLLFISFTSFSMEPEFWHNLKSHVPSADDLKESSTARRSVEPSKPFEFVVETSQPFKFVVETSQPFEFVAETAQPFKFVVETSQPFEFVAETAQPFKFVVEPSQPFELIEPSQSFELVEPLKSFEIEFDSILDNSTKTENEKSKTIPIKKFNEELNELASSISRNVPKKNAKAKTDFKWLFEKLELTTAHILKLKQTNFADRDRKPILKSVVSILGDFSKYFTKNVPSGYQAIFNHSKNLCNKYKNLISQTQNKQNTNTMTLASSKKLINKVAAEKKSEQRLADKKLEEEEKRLLEKNAQERALERKEAEIIVPIDVAQEAEVTGTLPIVLDIPTPKDAINNIEAQSSQIMNLSTKALNWPRVKIPEDVQVLMKEIEGAEYWIYAIGGCIRDHITGVSPHDYDLITNCPPKRLKELLIKHAFDNPVKYDFDTPVKYTFDNPIKTLFLIHHLNVDLSSTNLSIEDYLKKLDFTINTLISTKDGQIYDVLGIFEDFSINELKTVLPAKEFYRNNAAGILRAIRFNNSVRKLPESHIRLMKENAANVTLLPLPVYLSNLDALFLRKNALINLSFMIENDLLTTLVPSSYPISAYLPYFNWQMNEIDKNPAGYTRYDILAILLLPDLSRSFFEQYKYNKANEAVLDKVNSLTAIYIYKYLFFNKAHPGQLLQ